MGVLIRSWFIIALALEGAERAVIRLEAQSVSTPELTAAFLLNFVKFTTWPADALRHGSPIVICVSGSDQVADSLVQLTQKKMVEEHALVVRRMEPDRPLTDCHVAYGSSLNANRAQELVLATAGRPILTVSDLEDFTVRGGIANFFIEGARMRFAVNPDAAERARLRISSRLLTLAKVVRDARRP